MDTCVYFQGEWGLSKQVKNSINKGKGKWKPLSFLGFRVYGDLVSRLIIVVVLELETTVLFMV